MKRLFSILAFVATLVSPTWADFDAGVDAFRAGDYQTAMGEWRALAEGGNANAQHNVGILYNYGLGVLEDFATAAAWYRKAAEQGHANAQVKLGYLHATGRGVAQDASLAVAWFREAAEDGLAVAQYNIGMMYVTGTGIDTDKVHALMWLMLAADGGIEAATTKRDDLMASLTAPEIEEAALLADSLSPGASLDPLRAIATTAVTVSQPVDGDHLAHLASYHSIEAAHQGWTLIRAAHVDLLGDVGYKVVRAEITGQGTVYRLAAGPLPDRTAVRELCRRLNSRDLYCVPIN